MLCTRINSIHISFSLLAIFSSTTSCSNDPQAIFTMSPTKYEAPLRYCDGEYGEVVPEEFLVLLKVGHSLTDHWLAVGAYMESHINGLMNIYPDQILYGGTGIDDALLARIRADPGVEAVDCDIANFATPEAEV
ncbi:Nn.00g109580.m01.CDS01 [Neocucurbitaria sp. VM-36]